MDDAASQPEPPRRKRLSPGWRHAAWVVGAYLAQAFVLGAANRYGQLWGMQATEGVSFCVAPDGRHVVFSVPGPGGANLYLCDLQTRAAQRLTHGWGTAAHPVVAPSGDAVYYSYNFGPQARVWRLDLRTGRNEPITAGKWDFGPEVSADGQWLTFVRLGKAVRGEFHPWDWTSHRFMLQRTTAGSPAVPLADPPDGDTWYSRLDATTHLTSKGDSIAVWVFTPPDRTLRKLREWLVVYSAPDSFASWSGPLDRFSSIVAISPDRRYFVIGRMDESYVKSRYSALSSDSGTETPLAENTQPTSLAWLDDTPALAALVGYPGQPQELWRLAGGKHEVLLRSDWFTRLGAAPDATWPVPNLSKPAKTR